jgi:nucleoside-diphosphate-sugar epimerase
MKVLVTGPTSSVGLPVSLALAADNDVTGIARFGNADAREQLEAAGVRCVAAASGLGGGGGGTSCANAGVANKAAAIAVVENSTNELRDIAEPPFKTTTAKVV